MGRRPRYCEICGKPLVPQGDLCCVTRVYSGWLLGKREIAVHCGKSLSTIYRWADGRTSDRAGPEQTVAKKPHLEPLPYWPYIGTRPNSAEAWGRLIYAHQSEWKARQTAGLWKGRPTNPSSGSIP